MGEAWERGYYYTTTKEEKEMRACTCFLRVNTDITIDQMAVVAHGHRGVKGQIVILSSQEASKIKRENRSNLQGRMRKGISLIMSSHMHNGF